jgi:superfamily II DNA or RNA helicase
MTESEKILAGILQGVHSWTDLKPKLSEYNTSATDTTAKTTRAGKLFEYFTKLCFLHDSEFAAEYDCKDVYLYEEIPNDLKQKLNLPTVEHGIDLLIVDRDEKVIAIQCKFKNDETVKLNWNADKLGNFFGFARNADLHCVFSNSSDITQVAQNLTDNFKFFSYSHLQNISAATFEKMRNALIGEPIKEIKKPTPHDYQQDAIEAVVNHFKDNERGQLILPCGAGKTLTSLWIKEKLQATNTLVLVPSLALLRQIKSNWNEAYNTKFIRLNVCSEKDIDADIDNDIAVIHTYEIPGNVTSDKNLVASFLQRPENKVVFSTYQSLQVVVDALQVVPDFQFDLIIADEAHKTAGFEDLNKFTLVHNKEKVRGVKRLYMTATPRIASPELKAKHTGRITFLKDMSNPKVYGKEAYRMTFGTAITKKILVNYKIIAVGVSDSDLKKYIERNIQLTKSESITDYAHNYALNIVMEKYKAFHALTFHSRIKNAVAFATRHNRLVPNAISTSISGTQTTSEREIILKAFEQADKAVVSNAKCLTEGVDVPVIDVVYYSDPKNSKIDIVQSAGRALRKAKHRNKEMGFIVVPIFHKDRETVEDAIEKSDYKNLITVIRSLCDQDERLVTEINELAWEKENRKQKATIEFTFSDDQTERVIQFEQIQEKLKNALFNQVIETLKDSWEIHYKEVEQYFKANGNSNIPARYKLKNGFGLGTWCVSQRVNFNKGLLSDSEIKKLEKVNFDFDPDKSLFESDYKLLLEYKAIHGHVNVPTMGNTLGRKVNRLRINYRKGLLNPERVQQLLAIGFQFSFEESKSWEERFEELKEYYETHNTKQVSSAINLALYSWERRQREANSKNKLDKELVQKLNSINFDWSYSNDKKVTLSWQKKYELLSEYFPTYNSVKISKDHPQYEILKQFVKELKYSNSRNRLNETKLKLLADIGIKLENTKREFFDWDVMTNRLIQYNQTNGNFFVKKIIDKDLFNWLNRVRLKYRENQLDDLQINSILKTGYVFNTYKRVEHEKEIGAQEKNWLQNYNLLKELIQNGNSFSSIAEINPILNGWMQNQRFIHSRNKLKPHRKELLDEINFPFEKGGGKWKGTRKSGRVKSEITPLDWKLNYNQLLLFKKNHSHLDVPSKEKDLYRWMQIQRQSFREDILNDEQLKLLKDIEFPFSINKEIQLENNWNSQYEDLKKLFKEQGNNEIKRNHPLYKFAASQRTAFKKNKITPVRLDKLKAIDFNFETNRYERFDLAWMNRYEELKKYSIANNNCNPSAKTGNYKSLGTWVLGQRMEKKQNKLDDFKIALLNELGFKWSEDIINEGSKPDDLKWLKKYDILLKFKETNGTTIVPQHNKEIGRWVNDQRVNFKRKKLSEFRINKLKEIDFVWDVKQTKN